MWLPAFITLISLWSVEARPILGKLLADVVDNPCIYMQEHFKYVYHSSNFL